MVYSSVTLEGQWRYTRDFKENLVQARALRATSGVNIKDIGLLHKKASNAYLPVVSMRARSC